MSDLLTIVLGAPGEAEMPLLADLGLRDDVRILAVVDPDGDSLGSSIAEIMGLPVEPSLDAVADLVAGDVLFVMPLGPASLVRTLGEMAAAHDLAVISPADLRARIFRQRADAGQVAAATERAPVLTTLRPGIEEIERESAAIQESLVGLEDALAGDTILRRLLDLCTRAVGAGGGSIMLFDDASCELYIAFATGLSEGTLHRTRVKLGEGIAGRVAHTRDAELVEGTRTTDHRHRDRPDITSAVSVPLLADDRLLGVLNVSCQAGEAQLDRAARDLLVGLGDRLGRILDGVQQLQQQRTSRMFSLTEQQLRRLADGSRDLPALLTAWAEALAVTAEAHQVTLVVPCADGGLLRCDHAAGTGAEHDYEPLHNPAWLEVLTTGAPMVVRQDGDDPGGAPVTVFYLPIGRDPVRAGLAMHFTGPRTAHAFHALAGETVFLLERLLPDQVEGRLQQHRADRLEDLSRVLGDLADHDGTPGQFGKLLCEAVQRLTGAQHVGLVVELAEGQPRLGGGNIPEGAPWLEELPRLLGAATSDGWRITSLETGPTPLSVLVAVDDPGAATPALVLVGKTRTHALDGQVFTPLDAELVAPLAGLMGRLRPAGAMTVVPIEPLAVELGSAALDVHPSGLEGERALIEELRRELDRCDRYHNVCGLVLLKPALPEDAALELVKATSRRVSNGLRISDRVYCLQDGALVVLVPENVAHLDRLQDRVIQELRTQADDPRLGVAAARLAYPATKGTAEELLACLRDRSTVPADTATHRR